MTPPRRGRVRPRSLIACAAIASTLVAAIVLTPTASAMSSKKLYGADISPHEVPPSTPVEFTFTLTNESKSQMIGSANLMAPEGFTIPSTQVPILLPGGDATIVGNSIELRNLGLMPGETATLMFLATTASDPGSYTWLLDVRQANDFRGSGNSFNPGPNVDLTTTVGFITTVVACPADGCDGSATDGTTTADVHVDAGGTAGVLTITLLPTDAISCEGYTGSSATVDFEVTPAAGRSKTVTIMIAPELVGERSASAFEVCYSSPTNGFVDQDGNDVPPGGSGLLPTCDIEIVFPPCVSDRTDLEGGSVSVSFLAPEGDPKGHI